MRLRRNDKEQLVGEISEGIKNAKTLVLVNYHGLKVKEIHDLKKKLLEQGIRFQIIKNTLFKIALKEENIEVDPQALKQPIGIVWGAEDEVVPAKLVNEFAKTAEKLQIIGGIVNSQYADEKMIKQLANLPGRTELYAKLVGSLNAPITGLVNVLHGNLRGLVYVLDQYAKSKA